MCWPPWRLVAREGDLVVFVNDFAAFASDFEAVGAGGFAGGGDEHARGAVGEFHVRGDVVFDLDFVVFAETAMGADAHGHAENPLEKIEVMRALVEKDAAALAGPGGAPAAGGVVGLGAKPVGDDPIYTADLAEFAGADEIADFLVIRVGALVEHRREDLFFIFMRGEEAFAVGFVDRDRLLDHDVQTGLEGVDAERGVLVMRRGDDDGVDETGIDHLLGGGEGRDLRELRAPSGVGFSDGGESEAWNFAGEDAVGVGGAHVAHADDTDANVAHNG